jgi:hypothetical protein
MKSRLFSLLLALLPLPALAEVEVSGKVGGELRLFGHSPQYKGQQGSGNLSLFARPEFYWNWNDGADSLLLVPYLRLDQHDSERSHGDIRELLWNHLGDAWELRAGIGKVFWGVTEFQHLVDIINQTDGVEDVDGEDKLGQPLINLSLVRDWGILDLYLLPGFRERTFPGAEGRLRSGLVVDTDQASYESAAKEHHLDMALRWSHTIGVHDFGIHWFRGTNREPLFSPGLDAGGMPVLIPHYEQINQIGLDLQTTLDSMLWKFELIRRSGESEAYWAAQGGFEYTLVGINNSIMDLGLLAEYGWDERGTSATSPFQNDLFLGARLAMNDAASSELLGGIGYDLDHHSRSLLIEASRRFGDRLKVSLDLRLFSSDEPIDSVYSVRRDDHLQLTAEYFF